MIAIQYRMASNADRDQPWCAASYLKRIQSNIDENNKPFTRDGGKPRYWREMREVLINNDAELSVVSGLSVLDRAKALFNLIQFGVVDDQQPAYQPLLNAGLIYPTGVPRNGNDGLNALVAAFEKFHFAGWSAHIFPGD